MEPDSLEPALEYFSFLESKNLKPYEDKDKIFRMLAVSKDFCDFDAFYTSETLLLQNLSNPLGFIFRIQNRISLQSYIIIPEINITMCEIRLSNVMIRLLGITK